MSFFKHPVFFGGFKHFKTVFFLGIMNLPMPGTLRWIFARQAGVQFVVPKGEKPWFFIGKNVTFDTVHPENIVIYNGTHITADCTLLTHKLDTNNTDLSDIYWKPNKIVLQERSFIGTKSVICSDVNVGEGSIIGASSVVTKDIPSYEIWGGNPARFIKHR